MRVIAFESNKQILFKIFFSSCTICPNLFHCSSFKNADEYNYRRGEIDLFRGYAYLYIYRRKASVSGCIDSRCVIAIRAHVIYMSVEKEETHPSL